MTRKPDRNFAVAPSVEQLAEMCADIPCNDSGAAHYAAEEADTRIALNAAAREGYCSPEEPHDAGCDCAACVTAAEAQQDDYTEAGIHDEY